MATRRLSPLLLLYLPCLYTLSFAAVPLNRIQACRSNFRPPPPSASPVSSGPFFAQNAASISCPVSISKLKLIINPLLAAPSGPLTQLVKRTLIVKNPNSESVAFKVKTTAPKQVRSLSLSVKG